MSGSLVRTKVARRRGMSLVEVSVSTLLVGLVLVTSMRSAAFVLRSGESQQLQQQLQLEAYYLVEEVVGLAYQAETDTSSSSGTDATAVRSTSTAIKSREQWVVIDDAHGWSTKELTTRNGDRLPIQQPATAKIEVCFVEPNTLKPVSEDSGLKRVQVVLETTGGIGASAIAYTARSADWVGNASEGIESILKKRDGTVIRFLTKPMNGVVLPVEQFEVQ